MMRWAFLRLFFCLLTFSAFPSVFSEDWKLAYLASYPRSGNHWIRYLVEEATHIATSSVYCDPDPPHLEKVFKWGGYCCDHGYEGTCRYPGKNELIFLKTHFPGQENKRKTKFDPITFKETPFDRRPYEVTIRLVRHPIDCFFSRYIRTPRGPVQETVPTDRVKVFNKGWSNFQRYWNKKPNVITFRYEDFLDNPAVELKKLLEILNYPATDEDILRAVNKHPPEGKMLKHLEKFAESDLKLIEKELKQYLTQFNYTIF